MPSKRPPETSAERDARIQRIALQIDEELARARLVGRAKPTRQEIVRLREDRRNLERALNDIQAGEARGLIEGDRELIKRLLIARIAEIDRMLGGLADP